MKTTDCDDRVPLRRGSYVQVIQTYDEWADLIGIIEEFTLSDGTTSQVWQPGCEVVVFFPIFSDEARQYKLTGINFFTAPVKTQLKLHDGLHIFPECNLEIFDSDDL